MHARGGFDGTGEVAAAGGFGESEGAKPLPFCEGSEPLLFLGVGAKEVDGGGAQANVRGVGERDGAVRFAHFLNSKREGDGIGAGAAVGFGKGQAH